MMAVLDFDVEAGISRDMVIVVASSLLLLAFVVFVTLLIKRNKSLNVKYFQARWREILPLLDERKTLSLAVIEADKLVDEALKKSQYKGKTMGERLISASSDLSHRDSIWRAHKLRNKIVHESRDKPKKSEVKTALAGYRRALKDLGAIR